MADNLNIISPSPTILTKFERGVLTITLNRPKANAFTMEMAEALQAILRQTEGEKRVRCVLLTGKGSIFSAGQDLSEPQGIENFSFRPHVQRAYNPLVLQIRRLEKPVLAALNGAVAGAALGICLACDLRVAADTARIVVGFTGIGLTVDSGVALFLPALIGLGRASEAIFSNAPISAEQALRLGIVNRVVPQKELAEQAAIWAAELVSGPVEAMGLSKRALNKAMLPHLEEVLDYEAYLQDIAGKRDEHREGLQAFLEKRPARYIDYT
jgi:2-(1,2-epoxy-1,2-dihydrophenyl)acetyl-CoA isomerase